MSLNVVVHDAGRLDVKFVGRDAGNEGILSIIRIRLSNAFFCTASFGGGLDV